MPIGLLETSPARKARIALTFGLCDAVAPLAGLIAGDGFLRVVGPWAGSLGALALAIYGAYLVAFGPDGKLYFSQGAMTNTGIVGLDAYELGWLRRLPHAHDILAMTLSCRRELRNEGPGGWRGRLPVHDRGVRPVRDARREGAAYSGAAALHRRRDRCCDSRLMWQQ